MRLSEGCNSEESRGELEGRSPSNARVRATVRHVLFAASAAGLLVAAACGDVYVDPLGSEVKIIEARADASTVLPADVAPACPTARPRENTACDAIGSGCEYGKSADRQCNSTLVCSGALGSAYWDSRPTDVCHASVCPTGLATAALDGQPCTLPAATSDADEAVCNLSDGLCACTTGPGGAAAHPRRWVCQRPLAVCPANRPLAGQPCLGLLWCDYGACAFKRGVVMECRNGVWLTGGSPCN